MDSILKPVPDGYHTVTPYLTVHNAAQAIEFYTQAFGAQEQRRIVGDDGSIGFAELQIGDGRIMLSDEYPPTGVYGPLHYGGTPTAIHLFVDDVDAWAQRAISAGISVVRAVADQPVGVRNGFFACPFGHHWFIASSLE